MKIKRKKIIVILVYSLFLLLPFTFFINKVLLGDAHLLGRGILNLYFDFVILICVIHSLINKKKYINTSYIWLLYLIFIILNFFKMVLQQDGVNSFIEALPNRLYYFIIPLVVILLKNRELNFNVISNNLIKSTIIICPISIYMFLTSNYFGMIDYNSFYIYSIIGTPFARMFSIFGSPLVAGSFFTLVLLIMIFGKKLNKIGNIIIFVMNFLCLVLTFSRVAFVIFFVVVVFKYLYDRKIKLWKKICYCFFMVIISIFIIIFSVNNGIYFWNANDLLHNIRFDKWSSGLDAVQNSVFFGNDFSVHISSQQTEETTISDNSFLMFFGYYGLFMMTIVAFMWIFIFIKKGRNIRNAMIPIIVCSFVFCFFYDFVQLFPSNYFLVFLYMYVENQVRKENEELLNLESDLKLNE